MKKLFFLMAFIALSAVSCIQHSPERIVNMVFFVRAIEPRDSLITEEVLYNTVVEQTALMDKYGFVSTFLLQYDALIMPEYQMLMKERMEKGDDIGAWWEITQPHVEKAGLEWRGRYPWDWHVNVGFSSGYDVNERELLVDVYMEDFKNIFGKYPSAVGSWFIDAHTLKYMQEKYGVEAACMCRDQIGTDGYTFWGGYWNQAFYPSEYNSYMPAQTKEHQIDIPVFRMLGSDPSYQYDNGRGSACQGVVTLEPVYENAGKNTEWVDWFFKSMFSDDCLGFNYVQAGQENSFTWDAMKEGLSYQVAELADYHKKGIISIETLTESARWYRKHYPVTATTALSSLSDFRHDDRKTLWFNSRYYRINLLWEREEFFIRDIHKFNENFKSDYYDRKTENTHCVFTTLPVLDGFGWSTKEDQAKIMFQEYTGSGWVDLSFSTPDISQDDKILQVDMNSLDGTFKLSFVLKDGEILISGPADRLWKARFISYRPDSIPFSDISTESIISNYKGFEYQIPVLSGSLSGLSVQDSTYAFDIKPGNDGNIVLNMSK